MPPFLLIIFLMLARTPIPSTRWLVISPVHYSCDNSRLIREHLPRSATNLAGLTLRGNGPHVDAYCSELQDLCDTEGSISEYSFTPSFIGSSYVVLCPAAMKLGRASKPCSPPSEKQIRASASRVMFHLIMTVNNPVGSFIGNNHYGAQVVLLLSNSTIVDATKNADSYTQMAVAQQAYSGRVSGNLRARAH